MKGRIISVRLPEEEANMLDAMQAVANHQELKDGWTIERNFTKTDIIRFAIRCQFKEMEKCGMLG